MVKANTLKRFCRLTKYIEQKDPELYQAIDDLCVGHYFKPSNNSSGITLLYPVDAGYRKKIIKHAYSTDVDVAVNMIKSLILNGHFNSPEDMVNNGVVNKLNHELEVESATEDQVKFKNGLVAKKDENFIPMSHRENMSVFLLSGKGEISLEGSVAKPKKEKIGGESCMYSKKIDLHKLLESKYVNEIGLVDNVYVKKVRLQMKMLLENKDLSNTDILDYMGNDEFSDSYLLDMYCEEHYPTCFNTIYKAIESRNEKVENIKFDDYIAAKKQIVGADDNNKNVSRTNDLLKGLRSPVEVRAKVCNEYGTNKKRLGKDLFIVFCNISKDLWLSDPRGVDEFREFAYIASRIYTKPEHLVNQEFDAARDLTLYGNLLKSDVFKYNAQADFRNAESVNLKIVPQLPSPLEMSLFSLCHLVNNRPAPKTGGDPELNSLLNGL